MFIMVGSPEGASANHNGCLSHNKEVHPGHGQKSQGYEGCGIERQSDESDRQHDDEVVDLEIVCIFAQSPRRLVQMRASKHA